MKQYLKTWKCVLWNALRFPSIVLLLLSVVTIAFVTRSNYRQNNGASYDELARIFQKQQSSFDGMAKVFINDKTILYMSRSMVSQDFSGGNVSRREPSDQEMKFLDEMSVLYGLRDGVVDLRFLSFPHSSVEIDNGGSAEKLFREVGFAYLVDDGSLEKGLEGTTSTYGNVDFAHVSGKWFIFRRIATVKPE